MNPEDVRGVAEVLEDVSGTVSMVIEWCYANVPEGLDDAVARIDEAMGSLARARATLEGMTT